MWQKFLFLILITITLLLYSESQSQTHVSGYVSGVWTVTGSPYIADSTIVIHQDSLLTIEPGVVVNFPGYLDSMKVYGDLHAWGTERDTIVFDFLDDSRLYISALAIYDLRFEFCKFKYNKSSWAREIPISFINCHFEGINGVGFYIENSNAAVFNDCFSSSYIRTNGCTCEMINNYFDDFVNCYATVLTAVNNEFNDGLDVQGGGEVRSNYLGGSLHLAYNIHVSNNIIYGNIYTASFSDTIEYNEIHGKIDLYAGTPLIRNNLIINDGYCIDGGPVTVVNNTLICINEYGGGTIIDYEGLGGIIRNNILIGSGNDCVGIHYDNPPPNSDIRYNTYWNLGTPYINCSPTAGDTLADPLFVDGEEADYTLRPDSPCIDTGDPASPPDPDHTQADRGYAFFDHRIDHPPAIFSPTSGFAQRGAEFSYTAAAVDDGNFLNLTFLDLPYWLNPVTFDLIYDSVAVSGEVPPGQQDFTFKVIAEDGISQTDTESVQIEVTDYTILTGVTTGVLTAAASPYLMVDSLFVPAGSSLVIEPGCVLKAKYNEMLVHRASLNVYGQLTAIGTEEDSIYFTSEREEWESFDWFGIWFYNCNEDTSKVAFSLIEAASKGVFADSSSALLVSNSSFINNRNAIFLQDSSNIKIEDNYFQYITFREIRSENSRPEICYNYFDNPSTYAPTIYLIYSDAYVHNNIFDACWYITVDIHSQPMIINNLFTNIDFYAICVSNESYPLIYNNTISECNGGVILSNGNLVMKNNIIVNCTEGGLNSSYGIVPDTVMYNNIWCPVGVNYFNIPDSLLGVLAAVNINGDSCDIYGNISMDPQFEGGTPFSYYLQPESPCIDAGIDVGFPYFGLAPDMGAYEFDPSAANPDNTELFPQTVHLYPNYPNPFNPSTTIRFDIAQAGWVTLDIFDITGRSVGVQNFEPLHQWMPAGSHSITFDGSDLASGIYFARLRAGEYVKTRKLLLIK